MTESPEWRPFENRRAPIEIQEACRRAAKAVAEFPGMTEDHVRIGKITLWASLRIENRYYYTIDCYRHDESERKGISRNQDRPGEVTVCVLMSGAVILPAKNGDWPLFGL